MLPIKALIRKYVGAAVAWGFILTGRRARSLRELDQRRCVICACAHNPTKILMREIFEWFLKQDFHFVSQTDVLDAVAGKRDLPRRSIWLIFDDGWKGNLENVLPLLREYTIPATIAISPFETENEIAWPTLVMTHGAADQTFQALSSLPNAVRKATCNSLLAEVRTHAEKPLMSVTQIKELAHEPLITIENHTNTHAYGTKCTAEEFREEVMAANHKIELWIGRKPTMLFYPFGDWKEELDSLLPECGITATANSGNRFLDLETQKSTYALPRIALLDNITLAEGTCRLLKAWFR